MCFSPFCNIVKNIILIVISILLGILIAFVFSTGAVPFMRGIVKAVLIFSTIILMEYTAAIILSYFMKNSKIKLCFTGQGIWLLIASMGTIVTGIMSLGVILNPSSLPIVILTGFSGFFFSWMILANIFFIICMAAQTKPLYDF